MSALNDIPNDSGKLHAGVGKRYARAHFFFRLIRKHGGGLLAVFIVAALLFAGIAMAQHWFVHSQLYQATKEELGAWAGEVTKEIWVRNKWNLEGYRRAAITAPSWYVMTTDGLIIDIESKDKLQRTLRDLITTRIGTEFSPFITDNLEESNGKLYWKIVVESSAEPVFVRWKFAGESKEQKKFYVREGPKTTDLDNESTWHYIKNKWGKCPAFKRKFETTNACKQSLKS